MDNGRLLKLWPSLWTFADVADVEPTNNAAERGLRAAVIYRKLSLGSLSQGGERTIERRLSVDRTCRLQWRSVYNYLADALRRSDAASRPSHDAARGRVVRHRATLVRPRRGVRIARCFLLAAAAAGGSSVLVTRRQEVLLQRGWRRVAADSLGEALPMLA
jgi:hypothetical protein